MASRVEDLLTLAQMLDEGKINQREYDIVKGELISAAPEEWLDPPAEPIEVEALIVEGEAFPPGIPVEQNGHSSGSRHEVIAEITDVSTGRVPHSDPDSEQAIELDSDPSPASDLEARFRDWVEKAKSLPTGYRWVAAAVLLVVVGLFLFGGGDPPPAEAVPQPTTPVAEPFEAPVGSLGVKLEDLDEAWNDAGIPPQITKGVVVTPEAGPLDSFLYRFDESAVLAGAYDPSDGYLYAVMIKVGLFHNVLGDMNTHVCHLLHPWSEECIDAFREGSGVEASTLEGFAGTDHQAEWLFAGNTWRLTIAEDIETVRVIAPGQP